MRPTKQVFVGIVIAVAIAFALRWPQMNESLWLDELHTSWTVSGNWGDVFERAQIGNHSPIYFWLLRIATSVFELDELALRLPSLFAGLTLVAVVGLLVWQWTKSSAIAFCCAALVAIDPACIFYSQEARPYALLQLVAWAHVAIVASLCRRNSATLRLWFVLGCVLLFYIHYTSALFVFAEVIFLLSLAYSRGAGAAYSWRQIAVDVLLVAVCSIPAILHVRAIMEHGSAWKSFIPEPSLIGFLQQTQIHVYLLWPVLGAALVFLFQRFHGVSKGSESKADRVDVGLILSITLIPLLIAGCATEFDWAQLLFRRYLLPTYVAGIVLAALLWSWISMAWLRGAVIVLTFATSFWASGIVQRFAFEGRILNDRQQDWRSAVQFINERANAGSDIAFVRGGFLEADQLLQPHDKLLEDYNLAPVNNIYRLKIQAKPMPTSATMWPRFLDAEFEKSLSRGQWFVFNGKAARREEFLNAIRQQLGAKLSDAQFEFEREFGDVFVVRVVRK